MKTLLVLFFEVWFLNHLREIKYFFGRASFGFAKKEGGLS